MLSTGANHNHKEADDKGALPQLAGGEEVDGRWHPDNGRAHRRDKRQKRHQRSPENAAVQTGDPEGKATQRPLRQRHGDGTFTVARATAANLANKCCFT